MQVANIAPSASATSETASAKPVGAPDAVSWQAALAQAGDGTNVQTAATPAVAVNKQVAKSATKNAATAALTDAEAPPATAETLLDRSKKTVSPAVRSAAPATPKRDKTTALPVAAMAQPVTTPTMPAAPRTASAKVSRADASMAKTAQSTPAPAAASADTTIPPDTGHDAPQTITLPQQAAAPAQAVTPPAVTTANAAPDPAPPVTPQTVPSSHALKPSAVSAPAVPSVSTSKPGTASISEPTLPVISAAKEASASDKSSIIQPAFAAATVHDTSPAQQIAAPPTVPTTLPITQPSAAGLAAAVTAMHQSGQSGASFRLDPPGLGDLSVHVALGQNGQVNVLFVPSTQATASALQSNLPSLGTALAQSGLTLGQAQVGGQFNQNAGQGGYQQPAPSFTQSSTNLEPESPLSGLSAYA